MKRLIVSIALIIGIVNAEVENEVPLVLSFEEIHLPKAAQEFNNAKVKLIKAKTDEEQWSNTMKQRYETRRCSAAEHCIDFGKYLGFYDKYDTYEYFRWADAKENGENFKISPQKKAKFESLKKAIGQLHTDREKLRKLQSLEELAKRELAKAEYYKSIAQIKQDDEIKAQEKYDKTILLLKNYESAKNKYLKDEKEHEIIKARKNKLEKELKQVNKEFDRAKYNKLEAELENLREESSYGVSSSSVDEAYQKFENALDKLIGEL
ncbi:hypothetical protein OQH61_05170 [Helicobacter sp. MIT 21-1697]|uniref:hypothetical protein n=1 Tax=Helicobacter sp. MIT 21-1697 TaxID=2993733 RepID=UPI00224B64D8|nr:hypothetical protein [Helicobacter sp. MIT 21-1697]MCX2717123.1 hypothetical protein [Helicobacter sp. MIT 21-1697]